jgi:hypothetical protein
MPRHNFFLISVSNKKQQQRRLDMSVLMNKVSMNCAIDESEIESEAEWGGEGIKLRENMC